MYIFYVKWKVSTPVEPSLDHKDQTNDLKLSDHTTGHHGVVSDHVQRQSFQKRDRESQPVTVNTCQEWRADVNIKLWIVSLLNMFRSFIHKWADVKKRSTRRFWSRINYHCVKMICIECQSLRQLSQVAVKLTRRVKGSSSPNCQSDISFGKTQRRRFWQKAWWLRPKREGESVYRESWQV